MFGEVEDAAADLAEDEGFGVDQVVLGLGGDGHEAAVAGAVFDGGHGIGAALFEDAAVAVAEVVGDDGLGGGDGGLEFGELGLGLGGLGLDGGLEAGDVLGELGDVVFEGAEGGLVGFELLHQVEDFLLEFGDGEVVVGDFVAEGVVFGLFFDGVEFGAEVVGAGVHGDGLDFLVFDFGASAFDGLASGGQFGLSLGEGGSAGGEGFGTGGEAIADGLSAEVEGMEFAEVFGGGGHGLGPLGSKVWRREVSRSGG